jgi:Zn-dependent protease
MSECAALRRALQRGGKRTQGSLLDKRLDKQNLGSRWAPALVTACGGLMIVGLGPVAFISSLQGDPIGIALTIVLLIVCLGVHEAAHAWVAWKCGDSTARDMGRLTLNPIAHIDLFMTIVLPAILIMTTGYVFGGAKPVPVDFHRLRHPWRDMSLVAIAGPLSNFLMAILFTIAWKLLIKYGWYIDASPVGQRGDDRLPKIMQTAVFFNVLLAVFNMVPIPPLDGSRIMAWMLPSSMRASYLNLERFGLMIIMLLIIFVPAFQALLGRWMLVVIGIIDEIASLGGMW